VLSILESLPHYFALQPTRAITHFNHIIAPFSCQNCLFFQYTIDETSHLVNYNSTLMGI
jgi:hypothetical protein